MKLHKVREEILEKTPKDEDLYFRDISTIINEGKNWRYQYYDGTVLAALKWMRKLGEVTAEHDKSIKALRWTITGTINKDTPVNPRCPKCNNRSWRSGRHHTGKLRYKCKACHHKFTP